MNDPAGTEVDVDNVDKTFQELNFATYIVHDPTDDKVKILIRAAAMMKEQYPLTYRYVALYFAGHGRRNKQEQNYIVCSNNRKVFIEESIVCPLSCLQARCLTRLFFFDCCQDDDCQACSNAKKKASPAAAVGQLVAYACNKGEKASGNNSKGGIWTYHLCKNFRELDEPITTILAKTYEDVASYQAGKNRFQEPLVISTIGVRKLKQHKGKLAVTYSTSINNLYDTITQSFLTFL